MNDIKVPLALSLLGHAVLLALLVFFVTALPPLSLPPAPSGIAVTFAPSLPQPEPPPAPPPPKPTAVELPPLPPVPAPPPPTPLPPLAPLPAIEAPPPLPQQKPLVPRHPAPRRPERPPLRREAVSPAPAAPSQPALPPAVYNRPAPPAEISPGYRALLGAWLERHKRYPESARERDEEGEAVLRFTVDRSGRVVDSTIVKSSGYPDLDAAVASMMRGATLPPFPADMPQSSIMVTVPIRFSLAG